jgi:4-amino-4-deoxy-L-arabinose transferase-like glycosyltransferase
VDLPGEPGYLRYRSGEGVLAVVGRHRLFLVLLLALLVRTVGIDATIIGTHEWRQADTAAIARNFHESGYRFLYPQVDWGGDSSGVVEMNLPLYPFLVAVLYGLLGVNESYGRLLSVLFSLIAVLYLFKLARDHTDEETAIWAALFLAILPLGVFFGRCFIPESLLLLSSVVGLYCFSCWTREGGRLHFVVSAAFISLACLVKLPALYLGGPILFLAARRYGTRVLWQPTIWCYGVLVLLPVALWYHHAHQLFLETGLSFGIWGYGTGKWGNWDLVLGTDYWRRILLNRLFQSHLTWPGALVFVVGLFLRRRARREWLFDVWLLSLMIYVVIVGRGNYLHSYYQLPFLLPCVVFMGKVFGRHLGGPRRKAIPVGLMVALVGIAAFSAARLERELGREAPDRSTGLTLARELTLVSDPGDRVVALTHGSPTVLYLAKRKGWLLSPVDLTPQRTQDLIERGAVYVAGFSEPGEAGRAALRDLQTRHDPLVVDDAYFVLRLRSRPQGAASSPQTDR